MKPVQTTVRLGPGQKEELEKLAEMNKDLGLDVSQLIRAAVAQLLKYADRNGGRILLPIDFGERVVMVEGKAEAAGRTGSTALQARVPGAEDSSLLALNETPPEPKPGSLYSKSGDVAPAPTRKKGNPPSSEQ